jgi:hypothetical protein
LTQFFRPHYCPGVDSASNKNEDREYLFGSKGGRCAGLTILSSTYTDCLELRELQPLGTFRTCSGLCRHGNLSFTFKIQLRNINHRKSQLKIMRDISTVYCYSHCLLLDCYKSVHLAATFLRVLSSELGMYVCGQRLQLL